MNLLFITRKFPPAVGGMEKMSAALAREFAKQTNLSLIAWGHSQKYLPYFLPFAFVKSVFFIPLKRIERIHLGDALLAPLGLVLKYLFGIKTSVTVAGLDITYKLPIYQFVVPWCVARLDNVICISKATLEECVKRGVPRKKCVFIPCGVYPEDFIIKATRSDLEQLLDKKLAGKKVIITVGRLVKRKGVAWFIENVLPKLDNNYLYLVVGDGPEKAVIENLVDSMKLSGKVMLLGKISDRDLKVIYNTADVFVMPNIPIEGDMEGFGIVAIEASSIGLPVVASNLEGIRDAIINGVSGFLLDINSEANWIHKILNAESLNNMSVAKSAEKEYGWTRIGRQYVEVLS